MSDAREHISRSEQLVIGGMLRRIAADTDNVVYYKFLHKLANRINPQGEDPMTSDEGKMVAWLIDYATKAGATAQQAQAQLAALQQSEAAAQPVVDQLKALYDANNPPAAPEAPAAQAPATAPAAQ